MRSRCLQAANILHCYTMLDSECRPGLLQDGAGKRHALLLAAAQHEAALAHHCIIPVWHRQDLYVSTACRGNQAINTTWPRASHMITPSCHKPL